MDMRHSEQQRQHQHHQHLDEHEHRHQHDALVHPGDGDGPAALGGAGDLDRALAIFLAERTQLQQIAYRVIGSRAEAEEVVQEVWLRWQRTDRRLIRNPAAFLTTAATHLAINVIQSAHTRHASRRTAEMPESADGTTSSDPIERFAAMEDSLLLVVSRLGPVERAAYVLRHAFDYPYDQVAEVLRITAGNARQLVHRAQLRIERGRVLAVDRTSYLRLVEAFQTAARTGQMTAIERVLVEEVDRHRHCDRRPARRRPSSGRTSPAPCRS